MSASIDLAKFYETIDHVLLAYWATALGFPIECLRYAIRCYRQPRHLVHSSIVAVGLLTIKGIVAGCSLATTLALSAAAAASRASL